MTNIIKYLTILLVFQLGVSAYLHLGSDEFSNYDSEKKLVDISFSDIDTIKLSESDKETLTLKKTEDSWKVTNASDFPVAESKLKLFKEELLELKRPYPVGNTLIAAKNFSTADDTFKKKLVLKKGDAEKATLFLGTSPGFKKIHVRVKGEKKSYAIKLGSHNLQTDPQFWLDKELLKIKRGDIKTLQIKDIALTLRDNKPELESLPQDKELVEKKANALIKDATRLTFTKLFEDKEAFDAFTKEIQYNVKLSSDIDIEFDIRKNKEEEPKFYVKRSDYPYIFSLTKYQVDTLTKYSKEDLLKTKEQEEKEATDTSNEQELPEQAVSSDAS